MMHQRKKRVSEYFLKKRLNIVYNRVVRDTLSVYSVTNPLWWPAFCPLGAEAGALHGAAGLRRVRQHHADLRLPVGGDQLARGECIEIAATNNRAGARPFPGRCKDALSA